MFEKSGNAVVFSYDREDLMREVCLVSSYKSRAISDKDGGYAGGDAVMTEDEGEAFDVFLGRIAPDVYDVVLKLTRGVEQAFTVEDGSAVFKVRDNGGYHDNALAGVDGGIKEVLLSGVLREWYGVCGSGDFFKEYAERYAAGLRVLHDRLFDLRKKAAG